MNIRRTVIVFATGGIMLALGGRTGAQNSGATPEGGQMRQGPYQALDNAASKANGLDRNSIVSLVDETFNFPSLYLRMPASLRTTIKDRLVEAEISHRQGRSSGPSEESVASLFNSMAQRFGFPEYARTSASQLRYLRMHLAVQSPVFMGAGMTRPDAKTGDSINTTMSPVQAAQLIAVMMDQKLMNPTYQVSPAAWDSKKAGIEPAPPAKRPGPPPTGRLRVNVNSKTQEMQDAASKAWSSLTLAQAQDAIDEAFATLGI